MFHRRLNKARVVSGSNSIRTRNVRNGNWSATVRLCAKSGSAALPATTRWNGSGNARNRTALWYNSASRNESLRRAKLRRALSKEKYSLINKLAPDNGDKPLVVAVSLAAMRRGVGGHVGSEASGVGIHTE